MCTTRRLLQRDTLPVQTGHTSQGETVHARAGSLYMVFFTPLLIRLPTRCSVRGVRFRLGPLSLATALAAAGRLRIQSCTTLISVIFLACRDSVAFCTKLAVCNSLHHARHAAAVHTFRDKAQAETSFWLIRRAVGWYIAKLCVSSFPNASMSSFNVSVA